MLDLLTSSGNLRSARIGTALSLPAVLAYPCTCPHLGGAQHMLDLLTSSGNRRSARVGTAFSLPAVLAYTCTCPHLGGAQHMLDLLTSPGNLRSARIGTALSLPAVLAYPVAHTRTLAGGTAHGCRGALLPTVVAWCMLNLLTGCLLTVYLLAVYTYWLSIAHAGSTN
jgi:hypothetical protein